MDRGHSRLDSLLKNQKAVWMGIINATPDSFSDGGRHSSVEAAVARAKELVSHGAHIIDVGGQSTRPGSAPLSEEQELARVAPLLKALHENLPSEILLSLDTFQPRVVAEMAKAGYVDIINDVYAGRMESEGLSTLDVAAQFRLAIVLMHMQGSPATMQQSPHYEHCVHEVAQFLVERANAAKAKGISAVVLDPGIGFGKRLEHNLELLSENGMKVLCSLGFPVLIGLSRKRFILEQHGDLSLQNPMLRDGLSKVYERDCLNRGARLIRTHRMPSEV